MSLDSAISSLVSRLETVTARLAVVEKQLAQGGGNTSAPSTASSSEPQSTAAFVQEYEDLVNQYVKPLVELSNKLGDKNVADQAALFLQAANAQRDHLAIAAASKKPADEAKFFQPTLDYVQKIVAIKDANRPSKFFNNLSALAEGVPALGWVLITPTPGPYVGDMRSGSEFYSNRLLKEFKGNNQVQVDWVNAFNNFLKDLQAYIKKHHTTGLSWNPRGGDASSASIGSSSTSTNDSAPPPPGPPPPPPVFDVSQTSSSSGPDMSGVFNALSKGEAVTSGLRKVTDDMKTKNRKDKTSVVPATAAKGAASETKAAKETATKPPKFALEGNKWVVEYQSNNKNIVISEVEAKQTVYIYRCNNSTIQVKGKVNNISVDDCTKVAIVFDTLVSSFEIVNCRSLEVQVLGKVPSFAIDKTSGVQLYLSKTSLESEIVTSKSSEMNVLLPGATPDEDLVEVAIPEQYKSYVKDGKLVTEIVTHV